MTDRLADLKRGAAVAENGNDGMSSTRVAKGTAESTINQLHPGQENFMQRFFADVEIIKNNLTQIAQATERLRDIHSEVMVATTTEREESLTSQVTPILQVSNQKAQHVKSFLQRLSEENKLLKTSSTSSSTAASANEHRIRENLLNTLTRKFVDVMKSYQAEQQKFKTDIKKKMKRQIKVFNPEATEEEVEQVISSGHTSSAELLKSTILKGTPSELIQNAMRNVDEKNREVNALEASVTQLHEMFVDFAQLVEQQGELLDQIDYQVKQAGDFLDDANADMRVAVDYAIQLRKRQCCLAMILLVVVGVIVGIVFALKEKAS